LTGLGYFHLLLLLSFFHSKPFFKVLPAENSSLLIDPGHHGLISVFNKPEGELIKSLKHNFKNEDLLIMEVKSENDSMFYGTLKYAISGDRVKGWVKKESCVGHLYQKL
jgi:hypothetical protein